MDISGRRMWMDNRLFPGRRGIRPAFKEGLLEFFALAKTTEMFEELNAIKCPCLICKGKNTLDVETVELHLLQKGFMPDYYIWRYHGEPWDLQSHLQMLDTIYGATSSPVVEPDRNEYRMDDMVHDAFGMYPENDPMQPSTSALKHLLIDCTKLKQWIATNEHFPALEHLVIRNCSDLENIPVEFADIESLQLIELKNCKSELLDSAVRIQEEQEYIGIKAVDVHSYSENSKSFLSDESLPWRSLCNPTTLTKG